MIVNLCEIECFWSAFRPNQVLVIVEKLTKIVTFALIKLEILVPLSSCFERSSKASVEAVHPPIDCRFHGKMMESDVIDYLQSG